MKPKYFDVMCDKAPVDDKIGEQVKPMIVICKLTGNTCIHADPRKADEGAYENCRLCELYEEIYLHI